MMTPARNDLKTAVNTKSCNQTLSAVLPSQSNNTFFSLMALIAVLTLLSPIRTLALDTSLIINAGTTYSDNILLRDDNEISDWEYFMGFDTRGSHAADYLNINFAYNGQKSFYDANSISESDSLQGRARLLLKPVPNVFHWFVNNTRIEQFGNSRNEDQRDQRETRDILTTGPRIKAKFGDRDVLAVTLSYSTVNYDQSSASDSERKTGSAAWTHDLSETRSVTIDYTASEINIAGPNDFEREEATLRLVTRQQYGNYSFALGHNAVEREGQSEQSGFTISALWNRETESHGFRFLALRQLTDSGVGLGLSRISEANLETPDAELEQIDSNFEEIDTVERLYLEAGFSNSTLCGRCKLGTKVIYTESDFEELLLDEDELKVKANFQYRARQNMTVFFINSYRRVEFDTDSRRDEVYTSELALDWQTTRDLSITFSTSHKTRHSTFANADYAVNEGTVSFNYKLK